MLCLSLERINEWIDMMIPSFFHRLTLNSYTREFITNIIEDRTKTHSKSLIKHVVTKFKSTNLDILSERSKIHKDIIRKNFEYEKNEIKNYSILPTLLENFENNLNEIIHHIRAF
jgi:hypothetical protein